MQAPSTTRLQLYGIALLCAFAAWTGLSDNARAVFHGGGAQAAETNTHGLHVRHSSTVTLGPITWR